MLRTLSSELGSWIDQHPSATRVYADANVPAGLVGFMRRELRWDVFFVMEHAELRRAPDVEHYRLARQMHRTLITLDHDYLDDRRFPMADSGGVIVVSASDEQQFARLLERLNRQVFAAAGPDGSPLPLAGRKIDVHPEPADSPRRRWRRR